MQRQRLKRNYKRIYHPISKWEEIGAGMWHKSSNRKADLVRAVSFTGNHRLYGNYMMQVVREWTFSCENSLTNSDINHKAFIGHCAAAKALGLPEDIVRQAWGLLTDEQRHKADMAAERAINWWWDNKGKDYEIRKPLGSEMLF